MNNKNITDTYMVIHNYNNKFIIFEIYIFNNIKNINVII